MKFTKGINRLANAPEDSVFDLKWSKITPIGMIEAVRSKLAFDAETRFATSSDYRPIIKWQDKWYTKEKINDAIAWGGSLYAVSDQMTQGRGMTRYDSNSIEQNDVAAILYDKPPVHTFIQSTGSNANVGIAGSIKYIFVPYNKRGEVGPWYYSFAQSGNRVTNVITMYTNSETSYVEVYRTRDMAYNGTTSTAYDNVFYRVGTAAVEIISNEYVAKYSDRTFLPLSPSEDEIAPPVLDLAQPVTDNRHVPGLGNVIYKPTAKACMINRGRFIIGNVGIPLKRPGVHGGGILYTGYGPTIPAGYSVAIMSEYMTEKGPVYSSFVESNKAILHVTNKGEEAILVFIKVSPESNTGDPSEYILYERLTPDSRGRYVSKKANDILAGMGHKVIPAAFIFHQAFAPSLDFVFDDARPIGNFNVTSSTTLSDTILVSEASKPQYITYSAEEFGSPIVAIKNARLSEDESILNYDFYVFTEKEVYHCEMDESGVIRKGLVAEYIGLKDDSKVAVTKYGNAFVGTDNEIYIVNGRQISDKLTLVLDGMLGDIHTLTYDIKEDNLWVLAETGLYLYSFTQQGWVANMDQGFVASPDLDKNYIKYDREFDDVLMHEYFIVDGTKGPIEVSNKYRYKEGQGDVYTFNHIDTQPFFKESSRAKVVELRADYDSNGMVPFKIEHSVKSDRVNDIGENHPNKISLSYSPKRLRPIYPRAIGNNHRFRIKSFEKLHDFDIKAEGVQ
jgi:hypothetical protein